jgi:hypothetical protein
MYDGIRCHEGNSVFEIESRLKYCHMYGDTRDENDGF